MSAPPQVTFVFLGPPTAEMVHGPAGRLMSMKRIWKRFIATLIWMILILDCI